MKYITSVFALFTFISGFSQELKIEVIPGFQFTQPVDIVTTYMPDDPRVFVLEKPGSIYIVDDPDAETSKKLQTPFLEIKDQVDDGFEGGLLGLAFHPDFATNGYFFLNYTTQNAGAFYTRISRWSVSADDPNLADPTSEEIVIDIAQPQKNHNGGDIAFGPDGMLYIPTGDGGGAGDPLENGQSRTTMLGKVLRINVNDLPYTIPDDNPFKDDDFTLDEIWSIGWRNPWKVAFDRETGDFWAADVGQNMIEELDFEAAGDAGGRNYGWNCFEGLIDYDPSQCPDGIEHTEPVFWYDQSLGWKSITGGHVYRGTRHTDLVGKYIFTDYEDSRVFWLTEMLSTGEFSTKRYDFTGPGLPSKVATFGESSKGELYFATLINGQLWRISTDVVNSDREQELLSFTISPNPVEDVLYIDVDEAEIESIRIYDLAGRSFNLDFDAEQLDVSSLSEGSYILAVTVKGQEYSKKFVKL